MYFYSLFETLQRLVCMRTHQQFCTFFLLLFLLVFGQFGDLGISILHCVTNNTVKHLQTDVYVRWMGELPGKYGQYNNIWSTELVSIK